MEGWGSILGNKIIGLFIVYDRVKIIVDNYCSSTRILQVVQVTTKKL